ncbi:uncharacterized protein pebp4 isoform X2 [Mustelus asterias]
MNTARQSPGKSVPFLLGNTSAVTGIRPLIFGMKWPLILVLLIGLDALSHQKLDALMNDEESMCVIEKISDSSICSDDLLVIYLDLGNAACAIIPRCHQFRRLLSQEWGEPSVQFVQAEKATNYVLIMVDPDAPSKENPKYRFWRHWLVTNILLTKNSPSSQFYSAVEALSCHDSSKWLGIGSHRKWMTELASLAVKGLLLWEWDAFEFFNLKQIYNRVVLTVLSPGKPRNAKQMHLEKRNKFQCCEL